MTFYIRLSSIFPNSFSAKIFFIAFVGTHFPLIATVYFLLLERGGLAANLHTLGVLLASTLVGTGATLFGLSRILRPLYIVHDAMEAFELRRERVALETRFRDEIGEIMAMTARLISDVDRELRRKTDAANTDPLTGLLNRRGFDERVARAGTGALFYADLDHFKAINDGHGHDAGDRVLQQTAEVLARALRPEDLVARVGGEEFVAFLAGADLAEAHAAADRARAEIAAVVRSGGMPVTCSFGVAALGPGDTVEAATRRADAALYRAKSLGRNRVESAPPPETGLDDARTDAA